MMSVVLAFLGGGHVMSLALLFMGNLTFAASSALALTSAMAASIAAAERKKMRC
jgi:hypothetical protein